VIVLTILSTLETSFVETPSVIKDYDYTWIDHIVEAGILPGQKNKNIPDKMYYQMSAEGPAKNKQLLTMLWLLFNYFWVIEFIHYCSFSTFAGATASWYFADRVPKTGRKKRGSKVGELSKWPLLAASWRVFRYHMGTIAVTALIIALIKIIRVIVLYIESQCTNKENKLQKIVFCMIHCFLKCLQCCCDKINKNALIWTAVHGSNFCVSACSSFHLIFNNMIRTAALHGVTKIIYLMGEVSVALTCAAVTILYLGSMTPYTEIVSSPILPGLSAFIIGGIIAKAFFGIFDSLIDTIFLCFLMDEKMNKDSGGKMHASRGLLNLINHKEHKKNSEAMADKHNKKMKLRNKDIGKAHKEDQDDNNEQPVSGEGE